MTAGAFLVGAPARLGRRLARLGRVCRRVGPPRSDGRDQGLSGEPDRPRYRGRRHRPARDRGHLPPGPSPGPRPLLYVLGQGEGQGCEASLWRLAAAAAAAAAAARATRAHASSFLRARRLARPDASPRRHARGHCPLVSLDHLPPAPSTASRAIRCARRERPRRGWPQREHAVRCGGRVRARDVPRGRSEPGHHVLLLDRRRGRCRYVEIALRSRFT
jgi:hypothetical protein